MNSIAGSVAIRRQIARVGIAIVVLAGVAAPARALPGSTAQSLGRGGASVSGENVNGPAGLTIDATAEVLHDSNVLRAETTDGRRDDFRYSPSLNVLYNRSSGRILLSVNGLVGRDIYQYNSYLSRNRYLGGGSLTYRLGSACRAAIDGNYASRQNGIRDDASIIDSGDDADDVGRVIDNVQQVATYGINANCGSPSGRLSFGGGYSHSSISNDSVLRQYGNSTGDTFSGNIGIGILRPGQFGINGSYSTITYPDRASDPLVPASLIGSGVRTYRIGVSFSRPIGTRLSGQIGASFLHAEPSGGQAPYSSPAYNIGLTYSPTNRIRLMLTGSRDIVASTTAGALYRVVDQVELLGHYSLGQRLSVNANLGLIQNMYQQPFAVTGEIVRHNDTTKLVGANVTYTPVRRYDLVFAVNQTFRSSDPSILNYDSTRLSVTLAVHI